MNPKQYLLYSITTFLIFIGSHTQAAEQPINFYYGLGGGAAIPKISVLDPALLGELIVGIEENGWSLEAAGFSSLETGTDAPTIDYSIQGYHLSLGYRTIARNNAYYVFKVASTNMDFDFTGELNALAETSGISYSIGIGRRMDSDENLEAIYSYYDSDDNPDPVHMVSVRYLWEGFSSDRKSSNPGPFYMGAMLGQLEPDFGDDFDTATAYGLILGYDMSKVIKPGVSIELLIGASAEADSFLSAPEFPDTYTTSYYAIYGVFRSPGNIYFKGRLGYMNAKIEDDLYIETGQNTFEFDETEKISESGFSYSLGGGFKASQNIRFELEYTTTSLDVSGFKSDPAIASLAFLYSF